MADLESAVAIALGGFFVALSIFLLAKYRLVSQRITSSSDLGRELWSALEGRLRKQDERILDMMGKVDAMQSRSVASGVLPRAAPPPLVVERAYVPRSLEPPRTEVAARGQTALESTERAVVQLLGLGPRTSVEIKEMIGRSREHTARLMKTLFDRGLVTRDVTKRPFVYQLTDEARRYISQD